ncbi:MAG: ribonuclease H-like domain-containing protein [Bacteroidales bacterium]|nr:ribonuclease H-like domain-containing protein [Bacteroidales bacterium]
MTDNQLPLFQDSDNLSANKLNLTKPLVFLDLETTGINIISDRIIEICILKVNTDNTTSIKTQLINPQIPIPPETSAIHKIFDKDVKDKPTFAEFANELKEFLADSDLAGYNIIKFDLPMLVEEFFRANIEFTVSNRRVVDVQNIFHKMEQRNLVAAYKFYCNKELVNAHSAEADTIATYEVLKAQINRYKDKEFIDRKGNTTCPVVNDVNSLSEFSSQNNNVDLVGHIIFDDNANEIFNFGKYKGKAVADVFEKEPQYYNWMKKGDFPLSTKTVIDKIYARVKLKNFNKGSLDIK